MNNLSDFYQYVINTSIQSYKENNIYGNWDYQRFSIDDPGFCKNIAYEVNAFQVVCERLYAAYRRLEDEYSRRLFLSYLCYRIVGHTAIIIQTDYGVRLLASAYSRHEKYVVSDYPMRTFQGNPLKHYDFSMYGNRYVVDCDGLEYILGRGQYYYRRDGIEVCPEYGDFVIDGGACLGDTACVFSNSVGDEGRVYCFDPVFDHCKLLEYNINQFSHKNCLIFESGLSDLSKTAASYASHGRHMPGLRIAEQDDKYGTIAIDDLVRDGLLDKVDYIKLDIEGSELRALKGASNAIELFRPKMAISLYHRYADLFEIIEYLSAKHPFYSFFLDHYTIHAEELVLYCAPMSREDGK